MLRREARAGGASASEGGLSLSLLLSRLLSATKLLKFWSSSLLDGVRDAKVYRGWERVQRLGEVAAERALLSDVDERRRHRSVCLSKSRNSTSSLHANRPSVLLHN